MLHQIGHSLPYCFNCKTFDFIICFSGGHYQKVTGLSFTSDSGHLVSVGDDGNVLVWPTSGLVSGRYSQLTQLFSVYA